MAAQHKTPHIKISTNMSGDSDPQYSPIQNYRTPYFILTHTEDPKNSKSSFHGNGL
jgi:hypothetical protein